MALTPASVLADYSSGIGTQGATLKVNTSDKRVGIGTTNPQGTLQVGTGITMGSGIITATAANFTGDLTVGGELTYEDVTNVDSVGVITARQGIRIGAGASIGSDGAAVVYYGDGFNLTGIDATAIKDSAGGSVKVQANTSGAVVSGILTANTLEQTQTYPTIRPTLDLNFAATKTLDSRITFTRDSFGTFINELGIVKYASNNVPRFDHDVTTGESLGLLIEEARTNLAKYSSEINLWSNNTAAPIIATDNTTAPDGRITADKLTQQTALYAGKYIDTPEVTTNTTYSVSGFIKPVDETKTRFGVVAAAPVGWIGYVDTTWDANGAPTTAGNDATNIQYESYPNGWYKVSFQFTTDGSSLTNPRLHIHPDRNENGKSIWFWGAQLEVGSFATSYIPTNASTVTRGAENAVIKGTNFTDFYNSTEGTLVSEHMGAGDAAVSPYIALLSDGSDSERIILMGDFAGYQAVVVDAGSNQAILDGGTPILNAKNKNALRFKQNNFALSLNGGAVASDTSGTMPVVDQLWIGSRNGADSYMNNTIQSLKYYNRKLINAELQGLTA